VRFGTFFFQAVPWLTHDEVVHRIRRSMELFAAEVLPHFRD
jgi:hypothetical protein